MLILHSFKRCPYAIRVRMILEEKGLAYTRFEEDLAHPSQELLKRNPSGQVPVLVHEGHVIAESSVIAEYLDELYPTPWLMPHSPLERAKVRLWAIWCEERFKPDLDLFKYEWQKLSTADRQSLLNRLNKALTELAAPLLSQPYLLGREMTLADIYLFPFYRQLSKVTPNAEGGLTFPEVLTHWLERLVSRPSFAKAMSVSMETR